MRGCLIILMSVFLLSNSLAENQSIVWSGENGKDWFKNRRKKNPFGLNVGILGPNGWGYLSADYFIDSKINVEGGFGIQTNGINPISLFLGVKYHLGAKFLAGITPYFGVMDAFFWNGGDFYQHNLYFPIGLHKIKRNKWTWAVEVAYQFNQYANRNIWGSLKIGYRIF